MNQALPAEVYHPDQVRELDRLAVARLGVSGYELMQRAGRAAWNVFKRRWPMAARITVICGSGNNGGDGYAFARIAREQGRDASVLALKSPDALRGDALLAVADYLNSGGATREFSEGALADSDVIVDAILGSGLEREVSAEFARVIDAVNATGKPVLALDMPSGLDAARGRIFGRAIQATDTITFVGLKTGLFTGEGPDVIGSLQFSSLDLPDEIYAHVKPCAARMDYDNQSRLLRKRRKGAHKGDFGHVLVLGGNLGFSGAVRLAAEAAARTGAGLVSVATRPEHAALIPLARPELMARAVSNPQDLAPLLGRATVVAVGPGLGQSEWAAALLARILETKLPLIIDADALNLLAADPSRSENWVLTPHPGEAARLLNRSTGEVQADRLEAAAMLQQHFGGVVVLKGCGTAVADPDMSMPSICSDGNPGMASGGMGDALTGVIAALIAQGLSLGDAARLGVCLHARAADAAAADGQRGMLAGDLMPHLRRLANPEP